MAQMLRFEKYEAAGNDFIVIDMRSDNDILDICKQHCTRMCDRHFGIGADGILLVCRTTANIQECDVDAGMIVLNADGSTAEMCGNGIRCVSKYLYALCPANKPLRIATAAGIQVINRLDDGRFEVQMAKAVPGNTVSIRHNDREWFGRTIDVGNPHAVFEIETSPAEAIEAAGAFLSNHPIFPAKSNIEFIREAKENTLDMTVYERGVGPTLACGTGCVAAARAFAINHGLADVTITLRLPGGEIEVDIGSGLDCPVILRGGATHVFSGEFDIK